MRGCRSQPSVGKIVATEVFGWAEVAKFDLLDLLDLLDFLDFLDLLDLFDLLCPLGTSRWKRSSLEDASGKDVHRAQPRACMCAADQR